MTLLSENLGFVHIQSQRTGYLKDGPFHEFYKFAGRGPDGRYPILSTEYAVVWDDTGEEGEVKTHEIEMIPQNMRHITDGVRVCHCGPSTIEGVVVHRSPEELN